MKPILSMTSNHTNDEDSSGPKRHLDHNNGGSSGHSGHSNMSPGVTDVIRAAGSAEEEPPSKKLRGGEELDIRFLISSKEAGAIIGKQGVNINALRKNYKSSVTVPDCPGPERVLSIVTAADNLSEILRQITGYIDDAKNQGAARTENGEIELRLLVHTSHAGGIIGRGGQKIKELREETKAAIKVFTQCCPHSTERVCALQGPPDTVVCAVRVVLDVIVQTPIKGAVKLYEPFNCDPYTAHEYGGYGDMGTNGSTAAGAAGSQMAGPATPAAMRAAGGRGGGISAMGGRAGESANQWNQWGGAAGGRSANGRFDRNDRSGGRAAGHLDGSVPYWSAETMAEPAGAFGAAIPTWNMGHQGQVADVDNMLQNGDGTFTSTLSVPNEIAGAIIGKGGSRIRNVRKESGAEVSIENNSANQSERKVIIKGTQNQIHHANYLLSQSISEAQAGAR